MTPAIGEPAPDFTLRRSGGGQLSLADLRGRKVVLYFYPKANTPGCTQEAIAFSRLKTRFAEAGTEVIGVSADPVKAQDRFTAKHGLSTPLLSDETHAMLEAYGVWGEKTLFGRRYMGVLRTTVLIDRTGRIARVWPKVTVDGHAEDVLEAARAL
jgi:peroxiredoxin Q/BCP